MLPKRSVKAVRLVSVAGGVFAERIVNIELPYALRESVLGLLARQLEQVLIAPYDGCRPGKKRAVHNFVQHLLYASEEQIDITPDDLERRLALGQVHESV